jgi:hypothetical protein
MLVGLRWPSRLCHSCAADCWPVHARAAWCAWELMLSATNVKRLVCMGLLLAPSCARMHTPPGHLICLPSPFALTLAPARCALISLNSWHPAVGTQSTSRSSTICGCFCGCFTASHNVPFPAAAVGASPKNYRLLAINGGIYRLFANVVWDLGCCVSGKWLSG